MRLLGYVLLAILGVVTPAAAQSFPDRPIRIVIPYQPGGGTDILTRTITPEAAEILGQQLVVDNRPGGSTVIGTELVTRAAPDGYTLLANDSAMVVNPGLFRGKLPYDTTAQLTGVTMMASGPVPLLVHPSVPAQTVGDLVALAKAKPGTLNFGSGGNGTAPHLAGELFRMVAAIDIVHVPYKGTAPAMNDLLAGQVQMMFGGISSSRQFVEAGKLRPLAMSARKRNAAMPDVPTFDEAGLKGVNAESYWGIYAPTGTPPAILAKLNDAFVRALKSERVAGKLVDLGYEVIANTPDEHTAQLKSLIADWTAVIQKADIKME